MLARLSQMVCRRLREYGLHARTINLKLRYSDFTTITRAHTLDRSTQIDTEMFEEVRGLFRKNWRPRATASRPTTCRWRSMPTSPPAFDRITNAPRWRKPARNCGWA